MTYNAETKSLTTLYVGEKMSNSRSFGKKILTQTKSHIPHHKSQMVRAGQETYLAP